VFANGGGEAIGRMIEGLVPGHALSRRAPVAAQFRMAGARVGPCTEVQRGPFGAEAPNWRGDRISAHPDDAFFLALDYDAAAYAAVATG